MKVLIGTPAGNGHVTTQYLMSLISTLGFAIKNGVVPVIYTLSQESLLPRGRNHIAQVAMKEKYDKLFFIDADTGWSPEQFMQIVSSPFPIVAGCVPLKTYPIVLNYLPFREDEKYFKNALRSPESTIKMRSDYGKAEIPVAFTGTAFLCIDATVLYKLSELSPQQKDISKQIIEMEQFMQGLPEESVYRMKEILHTINKRDMTYQYPNPFNGQQETHWDLFGGGPMQNTYYSEDWAFCKLARESGYDIRVNMDVMVNHVGTHVYQVQNRIPVDHAPEVFRDLLYRVDNANPDQLIEINQKVIDILGEENKRKENVVHAPKAYVSNPNKEFGLQS